MVRIILLSIYNHAMLTSFRYVKTKILPEATWKYLQEIGVEFATLEDAQRCLKHIVSDKSINGRNLFLSARRWAPHGYLDLNLDDYSHDALIREIQADQVKSNPPENGLFRRRWLVIP